MGRLTLVAAYARALYRVPLQRMQRGPLRPSWSLSEELYIRMLQDGFAQLRRASLQAQRRVELAFPALKRVHITPAEDGEWIEPPRAMQTLLYFHGGGFCGGYSLSHRNFLTSLALRLQCRIFAATYRLAPEHPYPAAHDDALRIYQRIAPDVVAGDSAGGNLALFVGHAGKCIALCPWVDPLADVPAAPADWIRTQDWAEWRAAYAPGLAATLRTTAGPTLVQVGEAEGLCEQVRVFAHSSGARLTVYPDAVHDFQLLGGMRARAAAAEIADFFRS